MQPRACRVGEERGDATAQPTRLAPRHEPLHSRAAVHNVSSPGRARAVEAGLVGHGQSRGHTHLGHGHVEATHGARTAREGRAKAGNFEPEIPPLRTYCSSGDERRRGARGSAARHGRSHAGGRAGGTAGCTLIRPGARASGPPTRTGLHLRADRVRPPLTLSAPPCRHFKPQSCCFVGVAFQTLASPSPPLDGQRRGWTEHFAADQGGRPYYHHRDTDHTQWEVRQFVAREALRLVRSGEGV